MYLNGCKESLNPELALYGSKEECTMTNTVSHLISEVRTGVVSLINDCDNIQPYLAQLSIKACPNT